MRPLRIDRTLWLAILSLLVIFGFFEATGVDLAIQDLFYQPKGRWLVDREDPGLRMLFYTGPKYLIVAVALSLIFVVWRARSRELRRNAGVALLTLGSVPLLVGFGKDTTNVFCPWDITRYGGEVPYVQVLERFPVEQRPERRGRGFPAGHASGGFALFGLAGLARTRRGQMLGIATATALGGAMGLYQMAKGAHYLSHTLITAIFAWIAFLLWRRLMRANRAVPPHETSLGSFPASALADRTSWPPSRKARCRCENFSSELSGH